MPRYDTTTFRPPAPVAYCELYDPATDMTVADVLMLLDTGADVSLVPQAVVTRLGTTPLADTSYELLAFDDTVSVAPVVQLELRLARRTFRGRFLVVEQPIGILGRNILNALPLLLDGPNLTCEVRPLV